MKKIALAGLVAFAVIAISQTQASAWTNTKFGIGLNFERQSGGNSALWGLWRNGQPPGPDAFHHGPGNAFPFHGPRMVPQGTIAPPGAGAVAPQSFVPAPQGFPVQGASHDMFNSQMNFANPYSFANYQRPSYYSMPYYYGR